MVLGNIDSDQGLLTRIASSECHPSILPLQLAVLTSTRAAVRRGSNRLSSCTRAPIPDTRQRRGCGLRVRVPQPQPHGPQWLFRSGRRISVSFSLLPVELLVPDNPILTNTA